MPITKNNFAINLNNEFEGVDTAYLTVDFINTMAAEIEDLSDSSSTKAGLELVEKTIENLGVNIIGKGALAVSNTELTYAVRKDALDSVSSTTTVAAIQAAIRLLDQSSADYPMITADITGATVTEQTSMSDTGVNA